MKAKQHALMLVAIFSGGMSASYAIEVSGSMPGVSASAGKATSKRYAPLFGERTDPSRVTRIVDVKSGLRYVNVDSGEVVAFRSGEKISAWSFAQMVKDTSVDLGLLMPDLPGSAGVRVYIDRSDLFTGG